MEQKDFIRRKLEVDAKKNRNRKGDLLSFYRKRSELADKNVLLIKNRYL